MRFLIDFFNFAGAFFSRLWTILFLEPAGAHHSEGRLRRDGMAAWHFCWPKRWKQMMHKDSTKGGYAILFEQYGGTRRVPASCSEQPSLRFPLRPFQPLDQPKTARQGQEWMAPVNERRSERNTRPLTHIPCLEIFEYI